MSEKPFTKYLLRLATDAGERERFSRGGKVARISMEANDLDEEQREALLRGEQRLIDEFVERELIKPSGGDDRGGIPVTFVCLVERGPGGTG